MVDDQHTEPLSVGETVESAETVEETYFETIQRLAALSTHEYERCRKAEAMPTNPEPTLVSTPSRDSSYRP